MIYAQMIKEIEIMVENACKRDTNIFGYGIWTHHIICVTKYAKQLAVKLGADLAVVEIAALLHDYASITDKSLIEEHHVHSAIQAEIILDGFGYPEDKIQMVKECIVSHRGSVLMEKNSKEAECVASADAMAHVFEVTSLLHLAYVKHGLGIDEGKDWVLKKIERSIHKLCPEAKEMVREQYLKVQEVLG